MQEKLAQLRAKAMKLPLHPGVYIMKDKRGEIIYIGKAKALKNRVSQYFASQNRHDTKVLRMVEHVEDFDYILTDSEFEALILECSLIKQHKPKYNIKLKDDKGYSYIQVSRGDWPRISAVKQMTDADADYIGPYMSSFTVKQSVDEACKIFKLPTCSRVFPRDIGKGRPCLNHSIGQCAAPCSGRISQREYKESVDSALHFLKGDSAEQVKAMQAQMEAAAESLDFEKAARFRDRIRAVERIQNKQKVFAATVKEQDIMALYCGTSGACFEIFRFRKGKLEDREYFLLAEINDPADARREIIGQYYSMRNDIPPRITLDGKAADCELLSQWLSEKAGRKVQITVPQKGEQRKLVQMCASNAYEHFAQGTGKPGKETALLEELALLLGLPERPGYIEAYDISHTAGADNVGAMVVFREAKPYKAAYKRFMIKGFSGQDDYASMREVLERRFARYLEERETDEGFGKRPDLILLDGGQGQVSAVQPVLQKYGLDIPLFGMVKDNKHRTRAIAANHAEIAIQSSRQVFTLISQIQDEVHRFAIAYHHKKHSKKALASELLAVEGVGPARAKALLAHFKDIRGIKNATLQELQEVPGMARKAAQALYETLHPDGNSEAQG